MNGAYLHTRDFVAARQMLRKSLAQQANMLSTYANGIIWV
jgi:hypothetical protein